MSLDISFYARRKVSCPHCGGLVHTVDDAAEYSSGRSWYPILEELGYYVPYEKRTEENNWYGKDMVLTEEQTRLLYKFVKANRDLYQRDVVLGLIARALADESAMVINADW